MQRDEIRPPTPTQYQGVIFRSRSEAIFARALDLLELTWEYEPPAFQTGDLWKPDFLCAKLGTDHRFSFAIIEYKPRHPTEAYLCLIERRFSEVRPHFQYGSLFVFYGSTYSTADGFGMLAFLGDRLEDVTEHFKPYWEAMLEASDYRFDLKQHD